MPINHDWKIELFNHAKTKRNYFILGLLNLIEFGCDFKYWSSISYKMHLNINQLLCYLHSLTFILFIYLGRFIARQQKKHATIEKLATPYFSPTVLCRWHPKCVDRFLLRILPFFHLLIKYIISKNCITFKRKYRKLIVMLDYNDFSNVALTY